MQVQENTLVFTEREGPPLTKSHTHQFDLDFNNAVSVLRGFRVGFESGDDHHFGLMVVDIGCTFDITAKTVTVSASLGLRDKSTDWDDKYRGEVLYAVIVD